jgi:glycosyltransferase involved in cell wall biosynthesis
VRLGVVHEPCPNAEYRALEPMRAMERRGHEVVWPDKEGRADLRRLAGCDLVHVHRRAADDTWRVLSELARGGTAITFDNDDDFTSYPKESPAYKQVGGLAGQRFFNLTVRVAKLARCFTTPSPSLAEKYRQAGVAKVEVIGNYLPAGVARPRYRHRGVVIGWVGGLEHRADVNRIDIAGALQRIVAKHPNVSVECIGVDLKLPERYVHRPGVLFANLPLHIGGYDIGIAPLSDIPFNHTRSDIKVKEYAASGVPWLASPVGPYAGLGEAQGGWLVPDDGWFAALDRMVSHPFKRWRMAVKAHMWARTQSIDAIAGHWEQLFADAVGEVSARPAAGPPA